MGRVGLRKTSPWDIPVFNGLAQPMGWSANNRLYVNVLSIEKEWRQFPQNSVLLSLADLFQHKPTADEFSINEEKYVFERKKIVRIIIVFSLVSVHLISNIQWVVAAPGVGWGGLSPPEKSLSLPWKIFKVCEIIFSMSAKRRFGWAQPIQEEIPDAATNSECQNWSTRFVFDLSQLSQTLEKNLKNLWIEEVISYKFILENVNYHIFR